VLVLPTLTAASADPVDGGNEIILETVRSAVFSAPSEGVTPLFGPGAPRVLGGFVGNIDVKLRSVGDPAPLLILPFYEHVNIVKPHSDGLPWATPRAEHDFVADRDDINLLLRGLELDLSSAPSLREGECLAVFELHVQRNGFARSNNSSDSAKSATFELCRAGAELTPIPDGVVAPIGTISIDGRATPHPGFTVVADTPAICVVAEVLPPAGGNALEPFSASLGLQGVGGECIVRVVYLYEDGTQFGPDQSMRIAVESLSLEPHGSDGDLREAIAGYAVTKAPAVKVLDSAGNAVEGAAVTFEVASGGGWLEGVKEVTTGADGVATAGSWTLGSVGQNTLTVTSGGASIDFTATGIANLTLTRPPQAPSRLDDSVEISGRALVEGEGLLLTLASTTPKVCLIPPGPVAVEADGGGPLGTFSVSVTLTGATDGATDDCVIRAAYVTAADPTVEASAPFGPITMTFTVSPVGFIIVAGDAQEGVVGEVAPVAPTVRLVVDGDVNRPVRDVDVTFTVVEGGGSLTGSASSVTVRTGTEGVASGVAAVAGWALGTTAGENSLSATVSRSVDGVAVEVARADFTATGLPSDANRLTIVQEPSGTVPSGEAFEQQPQVRLVDEFGNAVRKGEVKVVASLTSGDGELVGVVEAVTDDQGVATFVGLGIAGPVGGRAITFTAVGIASVASAAITVVAGPAAKIDALKASGVSTVGTPVPDGAAPSVRVVDAFDNPVAGVDVTFTVTGGGGSFLNGATSTVSTGTDGVAAVTGWTLGTEAGTNTLLASVASLSELGPVALTAEGTPAAPAEVEKVTGDAQEGVAGMLAPVRPSVRVTDTYGNPVPDASVWFSVEAGGGSVLGGATLTGSDGVATLTNWTLGVMPGNNGLTAVVSSGGIEVASTVFVARGTQNLVIRDPGSRTTEDTFVTIRGRALPAVVLAERGAVLSVSASGGACSSPSGVDRGDVVGADLLVAFSARVPLTRAAGDCAVGIAYSVGDATIYGRSLSFVTHQEVEVVLTPPTDAELSEPASVQGIELNVPESTESYDGETGVTTKTTTWNEVDKAELAVVENARGESRASISAQVVTMQTTTASGDGAIEGDPAPAEVVGVADQVDVWVAAPIVQVEGEQALLVDSAVRLTVEGDGYEPGRVVSIYMFSTPTLLGTALVGDDGEFVGDFELPSELSRNAMHTLRVIGYSAEGNLWTLAAPVFLVGPDPITPPMGADGGTTEDAEEPVETAVRAPRPTSAGADEGTLGSTEGAADAAVSPSTPSGPPAGAADPDAGATRSDGRWDTATGYAADGTVTCSRFAWAAVVALDMGCLGMDPTSAGALGLAALLVVGVLWLAWRRRDEDEDDPDERAGEDALASGAVRGDPGGPFVA
jgi:hypothetical protein